MPIIVLQMRWRGRQVELKSGIQTQNYPGVGVRLGAYIFLHPTPHPWKSYYQTSFPNQFTSIFLDTITFSPALTTRVPRARCWRCCSPVRIPLNGRYFRFGVLDLLQIGFTLRCTLEIQSVTLMQDFFRQGKYIGNPSIKRIKASGKITKDYSHSLPAALHTLPREQGSLSKESEVVIPRTGVIMVSCHSALTLFFSSIFL